MEANCNTTVPVKTFIDKVKDADLAVWNAIGEDPNVKSALAAVATMGYEDSNEFHHTTCYLLNCISNAYLKATAGSTTAANPTSAQATEAEPARTPAIIFSSARNNQIPGDYLGSEVKPDIAAFLGDTAKLAIALLASVAAPFCDLVDLPLNLSFGQWKPQVGELGQLLGYLSALKRCRPDLPTVHGLFLDASNQLMLISLNACGSWSSDSFDIGFKPPETPEADEGSPFPTSCTAVNEPLIPATDTWIAYVVLLYRTHAARDARFSLVATNSKPVRVDWQISLGNYTPIVRPFHATLGPGRMTWASFALDPSRLDPSSTKPLLANGFFKMSWQDIDARFHESKLLERAHRNGWLPGLVRHWYTALDSSRQISVHDRPALSHPIREAEYIYLASIGHPLSQCESALHLLKTIYDAAETHFQLAKRGILHGDMSWFNILCNPWHDDATVSGDKQVSEGIPCIDYILTGNAKESQPCALVLDLDHAAVLAALYDPRYAGRAEKTGTPMFVSVELSSQKAVKAGTLNDLDKLAERLAVLDGRPELFARAFPEPEGDDGFMQKFLRVVDLEKQRMARGEAAHTNPASLHRPYHDVESLYWILVWGFGRACPLGDHAHGRPDDVLSQVVDAMLAHRLGAEEVWRPKNLFGEGISDNVFHESLRVAFVPVLQDLGTYLAIPWRLYMKVVNADHAHVAIRRLLLPLIDDVYHKRVANVLFNTAQPRTAMTIATSQQLRLVASNQLTQSSARVSTRASMQASVRAIQSNSQRAANSNLRGSGTTPTSMPAHPPQQPSVQGIKRQRKALDDYDDGVYAGGNALKALPGDFYEDKLADRATEDEDNSPVTKRAKKVEPKRNHRDVDDLIEMFLNDRNLWFGSGFRNEAEAKAVADLAGK